MNFEVEDILMTDTDLLIQNLRRENAELSARVPNWISVKGRLPGEFISVLGRMTDAGYFPSIRECYRVGNSFFFPALKDIHPVDFWTDMPEPRKEQE